jgi:hypothetical protein
MKFTIRLAAVAVALTLIPALVGPSDETTSNGPYLSALADLTTAAVAAPKPKCPKQICAQQFTSSYCLATTQNFKCGTPVRYCQNIDCSTL